jgi:hypothetical protein
MPEYVYELRRADSVLATGRLGRELHSKPENGSESVVMRASSSQSNRASVNANSTSS